MGKPAVHKVLLHLWYRRRASDRASYSELASHDDWSIRCRVWNPVSIRHAVSGSDHLLDHLSDPGQVAGHYFRRHRVLFLAFGYRGRHRAYRPPGRHGIWLPLPQGWQAHPGTEKSV